MEELFLALELRKKYNQMDIEDCVSEFESYTNQKVPKKAVYEFKFCGLNNVDFFTSDWLNEYGLINLLEYQKQKAAEQWEKGYKDYLERMP